MNAPDLKRFALLAELEEAERDAIGEVLEPLELEAGVELFAEGEQGEGLYFVAEGRVRTESQRLGHAIDMGPGAALGTFSLVSSGPREVRAETMSRVRLLVLRRSAFRRFADVEPRAGCRLLEAILRETARSGRESLASVTGPAIDRSASAD